MVSEAQVLVMIVTGPLALAWKAADSVRSASTTLWQGLKPIGKVAKSASGLVRTTSLAATSSGASMADMTQQVSHPRAVNINNIQASSHVLQYIVNLVWVFL